LRFFEVDPVFGFVGHAFVLIEFEAHPEYPLTQHFVKHSFYTISVAVFG